MRRRKSEPVEAEGHLKMETNDARQFREKVRQIELDFIWLKLRAASKKFPSRPRLVEAAAGLALVVRTQFSKDVLIKFPRKLCH